MTRSFKFANILSSELRKGAVELIPGCGYRVVGQLDTEVVLAEVRIAIPLRFRDLKQEPPVVICDEPWMKTGAEWHNGPPLCWVLHAQWRDVMNWKQKPVKDILEQGREWFFKNVRCLINRHYTAHLDGLTFWPSEWDYWDHFQNGIDEYKRGLRTKAIVRSR